MLRSRDLNLAGNRQGRASKNDFVSFLRSVGAKARSMPSRASAGESRRLCDASGRRSRFKSLRGIPNRVVSFFASKPRFEPCRKRHGLGARALAVRDEARATREKIRSVGSVLRVRDRGDYIFEWAFQIPPPQPKKFLGLVPRIFFYLFTFHSSLFTFLSQRGIFLASNR